MTLWCSINLAQLYKLSLCNWRAREASETLLVVVHWKRDMYIHIYTYTYRYVRHTLVAQFCGYIMWEELSVSHF